MKKIISFLLSTVLVLSLHTTLSFASGDSTILSLQDFSHLEEGTKYTQGNVDAYGWQCNGTYNSEYQQSAEIVSEDGNNVVKISNHAYRAEFLNNKVKPNADTGIINVDFRIKMADKNSAKKIYFKGETGEELDIVLFSSGGDTYIKDHTTSSGKLVPVSGFKWEVNQWIDVNIQYQMAEGYVKLTLDNGTVKKSRCIDTNAIITDLYQLNFVSNTTGNAERSTTFYLDDVSVTGLDRFTVENHDFNDCSTTDSTVTGFTAGQTSGITSEISYVSRSAGDMALKVGVPGNGGSSRYWQITKFMSDIKFTNDCVLLEAETFFPDQLIQRSFCVRTPEGGQTPVVSFTTSGTIKVGNDTAFNSYVYKYRSGEGAPWYSIKAYLQLSTGKVRAEVSNGIENKVLYGTIKNNATTGNSSVSAVTGMDLLVQGSENSIVYNYYDNFKLSSFVVAESDFFTPKFTYTFDDVTTLNDNLVDYYQNNNGGWYTQNARADAQSHEYNAIAVGTEIDGRKALKVTTDGTTAFEVMNYIPANKITRYTLDVKTDDTSYMIIAARGVNLEGSNVNSLGNLLKIKNGKVYTLEDAENGDTYIGEVDSGVWHRIALEFDLTAGTYTAKVVNLDDNTIYTSEATPIPNNLRNITVVEYYIPYTATTVYMDNVFYGQATTFALLSDTADGSEVDAAIGVEILTTAGINPAESIITFAGSESTAWIDANGFNSANIRYLDPNTEYTVNYTLTNMFGESVTDSITFTTTGKGYGLSEIVLSDVEGGKSASVSGRLRKGETAQLIIAVYDGANTSRLIGAKLESVECSVEDKTFTVTVDADANNTVKAFLWDDMTPLKNYAK